MSVEVWCRGLGVEGCKLVYVAVSRFEDFLGLISVGSEALRLCV